jgi:hypothetical protein
MRRLRLLITLLPRHLGLILELELSLDLVDLGRGKVVQPDRTLLLETHVKG